MKYNKIQVENVKIFYRKEMIKGVIFDFNGTLFWDTDYHSQAFDVLVERYREESADGYRSRPITPADKRDYIMGRPNDLSIPFIFGREMSKEEIFRFGEEKEEIYRELCRGKVELAPGCRTLFQALREAGVPFTIASSADEGNIDFYYEETDLEAWIPKASIVYNDGTILHGKPAPEIFLRAAEKLGVDASECAIFEDSASGIAAAEAAHAARIIVVSCQGGDHLGSYPVIDNFEKAIPLLDI